MGNLCKVDFFSETINTKTPLRADLIGIPPFLSRVPYSPWTSRSKSLDALGTTLLSDSLRTAWILKTIVPCWSASFPTGAQCESRKGSAALKNDSLAACSRKINFPRMILSNSQSSCLGPDGLPLILSLCSALCSTTLLAGRVIGLWHKKFSTVQRCRNS